MTFGSDVINTDSITKASNKIINAHISGKVVLICATCMVKYDGTAKSKLHPEKRTIIIKPDDSLLVHSSTGVKPVNWQTSDADIKYDIEDGNLIIKSIQGEKTLIIKCYTIHRSIHYEPPNKDVKTLAGTENDMHLAILNTPDLIEEGLHNLIHEKEISSGSIDIYAKDKNDIPVIIEVKRKKAQLKHIDQLKRYVSTIQSEEDSCSVRGIIVAPSISKSARNLLENNLEFKSLNPEYVIPDDF